MHWVKMLESKKTIFEIAASIVGLVSAVFLGIMALMLTRAANQISEAQLSLAKSQAAVADLALHPRFRFEVESTTEAPDLLRIFNEGAPIEELMIKQAVFIELRDDDGRPSHWPEGPKKWRIVPVYYYGNREYTGSLTGLVGILSSNWSELVFSDLDSATVLRDLERDLQVWKPNLHVIMRPFIILRYSDALRRWHSVAYEIQPDWSLHMPPTPRRLAVTVAERIEWAFELGGPEPLFQVSVDTIKSRWDEYDSAEKIEPFELPSLE